MCLFTKDALVPKTVPVYESGGCSESGTCLRMGLFTKAVDG